MEVFAHWEVLLAVCILGLIPLLIGFVYSLVRAYTQGILWVVGLIVLHIPVMLVFSFKHWRLARRPLAFYLVALLILGPLPFLRKEGLHAEIRELKNQISESQDDDRTLKLTLATRLIEVDDYSGAIETYEALLSERPFDDTIMSKIAFTHYKAKDYEQSVYWAKKAILGNPANASALHTLALSYEAAGDALKAAEYNDKACEQDSYYCESYSGWDD